MFINSHFPFQRKYCTKSSGLKTTTFHLRFSLQNTWPTWRSSHFPVSSAFSYWISDVLWRQHSSNSQQSRKLCARDSAQLSEGTITATPGQSRRVGPHFELTIATYTNCQRHGQQISNSFRAGGGGSPPVQPRVRTGGASHRGGVCSRKSQPDRGAHRLQPGICAANGGVTLWLSTLKEADMSWIPKWNKR